MFEATQDGLGKNAPVHSIHGSLLAVGELLRLIEFSTFALLICIIFLIFSTLQIVLVFTFSECYYLIICSCS